MKLVSYVFPLGALALGMIPAMATAYYWNRFWNRSQRHSPLTRELLRPPGHSLRQKIDAVSTKLWLAAVGIAITPLQIYAFIVTNACIEPRPPSLVDGISWLLLTIGFEAYFCWRLWKLATERRKYVLGLEGELATGEELNQLMLYGCRVFHDIQTQYGNIDHVVISPSGVFAVNTKMRGKRGDSSDGQAEMTVDNERSLLIFPDCTFPIPAKQLETESRWLTEQISSALGERISVESILAFPGWFIKDRIGKSSVYVINPRNPVKFFVHSRKVFSPEMIQKIAHQIEQLCRDVAPSFANPNREIW